MAKLPLKKPFNLRSFIRRDKANKKAWNRNIKLRDNKISDAKFFKAQGALMEEERHMIQELAGSPEAWRLCDRLVYFQAPKNSDNHVLGDKLREKFPHVIEDSELGQGYVYLNKQLVKKVIAWLKKHKARRVYDMPAGEGDLIYLSDITLKEPTSNPTTRKRHAG